MAPNWVKSNNIETVYKLLCDNTKARVYTYLKNINILSASNFSLENIIDYLQSKAVWEQREELIYLYLHDI